jgi:hypothetical protein
MLAYAGVCWRMLAYAGVCWRMLTYAVQMPPYALPKTIVSANGIDPRCVVYILLYISLVA